MWKPVTLDDKDVIDLYLKDKNLEISELTFTNLYLWNQGQSFSYRVIDDFLVVKSLDINDNCMIFLPVGKTAEQNESPEKLRKVIEKLIEECEDENFFFIRSLTDKMKSRLEVAFPEDFEFTPTPEYSDYVYDVEKLINLSGRKFHSKKNQFNKFKKLYKFEYIPLTVENAQILIDSQCQWFNHNNVLVYADLEIERKGIIQVINNIEHLDVDGAYITIDNKIAAFTLAEQLSDDTVVIHIEKAVDDFPGAYQAINKLYLENRWSDMTYVNRECDLGIEGLRKAKESYRPVFMVDKYKAVLKK